MWGVERWHTPGEWSRPLAQDGYDFARDEVQRLEWAGRRRSPGGNSLPRRAHPGSVDGGPRH